MQEIKHTLNRLINSLQMVENQLGGILHNQLDVEAQNQVDDVQQNQLDVEAQNQHDGTDAQDQNQLLNHFLICDVNNNSRKEHSSAEKFNNSNNCLFHVNGNAETCFDDSDEESADCVCTEVVEVCLNGTEACRGGSYEGSLKSAGKVSVCA